MPEGSGGIGAVSAGIAEPVVWLILVALVILVIVGGLKLAKMIWAMFAG